MIHIKIRLIGFSTQKYCIDVCNMLAHLRKYKHRAWNPKIWIQALNVIIPGFVTLEKTTHLSKPQFPHF